MKTKRIYPSDGYPCPGCDGRQWVRTDMQCVCRGCGMTGIWSGVATMAPYIDIFVGDYWIAPGIWEDGADE